MNINELNEDNLLSTQQEEKFYEVFNVVEEVIRDVISSDLTRSLIEERVKSMGHDVRLPKTDLSECIDSDIGETIDLFLNSGAIIDGIEHSSRKEEIEKNRELFESFFNED